MLKMIMRPVSTPSPSFEKVASREESTFLETYPDEIFCVHRWAWAALYFCFFVFIVFIYEFCIYISNRFVILKITIEYV